MIALIAAVAEDRVIGRNGSIPWHIPEDLALFKKLTLGHTVIMGRRTYESLGKPLPGRRNIVVSRTLESVAGGEVYDSLFEALRAARQDGGDIFLIGGASIYREGLEYADTMFLSMVKEPCKGDTFFPDFDTNIWECTEEVDYSRFTFTRWTRTRLPGS